MSLTREDCDGAACPEGRAKLRLSDSGGLYLEVKPSGTRHWYWKYRIEGREKRLALGAYPSVSLMRARAERDVAREVLKAGSDPSWHKRPKEGPAAPPRFWKSLGVLLSELRGIGAAAEADEIEEIALAAARISPSSTATATRASRWPSSPAASS